MALTVVGSKGVLSRRLGPFAGLADLNDALIRSARILGISPLDPYTPVDADLLSIDSSQTEQFHDVACERALRAILENLDPIELARAGISGDVMKIEQRLNRRLDDMEDFILRAYNVGLPSLEVGTIDLNFNEQFDPSNPPIEI